MATFPPPITTTFLADAEPVPEVRVQKKLDSLMDSVQVDAGNREVAAAMRPDREHDGVEALLAQLRDCEIAARRRIQFERDIPGFQNFANLRLDHGARKAILRNAQVQHSAGDLRGFEDRDRITHQRQIVRRRQSDRSAADDRDLVMQLWNAALLGFERMPRLRPVAFREKALQRPDRDRPVDSAAAACGLARMRAHAAADARHRVRIARVAVRLLEAPLRDERNVPPRIGARGACHHAREVRVEPLAIDAFVSQPFEHDERSLPRDRYFARLNSTVALPETVTGLDWIFMPSCQAETV